MNARLCRKLRAAVIAIDATARNVEVDRAEPEEREVLARVCDELARALRARDSAMQVEGAVVEMPSQQ